MGERACAENVFKLSKQVTERNTSQSFYDLYARSFHTIAHKLYGYYKYRTNNLILHIVYIQCEENLTDFQCKTTYCQLYSIACDLPGKCFPCGFSAFCVF